MKILHVVPTYVPAYRYGGPIRSVHGLCKALAEAGHEVHVCTTNVDGPLNTEVELGKPVDVEGVKVWYFPSTFLRRLYYSPSLENFLRAHVAEFDIAHIHAIFSWVAWRAARECRFRGIPYIISPRGMLIRDLIMKKNKVLKNLWIGLLERKNIEKSAAVHFTTEIEKREFLKFGLKSGRLFVIPNGIVPEDGLKPPPSSVSPKLAEAASKPFVLFVGRVHWVKGLDRLIPAMSRVRGARLVIAGNDPEDYEKKMRRLADVCGVGDRVEFVGAVNDNEKRFLYSRSRVFVLPSYSENFGNVVLEAMAEGCPVVVTPEVGLSDFVRACGGGLVPKGDPDEIGKAVSSLFTDPEQASSMGRAGKQAVEKRFSWKKIAAEAEEMYERSTPHD